MDARDVVVFLGPSLPIPEAQQILPARYFGPARCGDVLRARRLSPRIIAIVDGVFASTPAVWHKEILLALDDGLAVFGASSMGALRAAELGPFGMIGIGRIFEAYRDGLYTDDDEVALLHGPAESSYQEMSEAMVNIRATVAHAVSSGVISTESAERVIRRAKAAFYQDRSMTAAIDQAWAGDPRAEEPKRFRRFIANGGYVNQKRLDAVRLLEHLAACGTAKTAVAPPVHRTSFIVKLHLETACGPFEASGADLPDLPIDERVALEARALGPLYGLLRRLARLVAVVHGMATGRAIPGEPNDRPHAGFETRLALINSVVDKYTRTRGQHTAERGRRRYMLDMMRLDEVYRRFRAVRHATGMEIGLYRQCAALWAIVDEQLVRMRVGSTVQTLSDEFRRKRGLERRTATLAWRRENDLDGRGYERIVAMDARLALVTAGSQAHALGLVTSTDPGCWLVDAIRLAGLYSRLERRVKRSDSAGKHVAVSRVCKNSAPYEKVMAGRDR